MATIETDLKEVFAKLDQRLDRMETSLNELKVSQAEIRGDIKALDEKVTGLGKRIENQEFTNRGILVAVIIALIGGAAKLFGVFPNP
jgi:peptidoglycan hydrolase CwlO-like protein